MKKYLMYALFFVALLPLGSCGDKDDDEEGNETTVVTDSKMTWAQLVKNYPSFAAFPSFDGEVENQKYMSLGGMETVTFMDFDSKEITAKNYYAKLIASGFEKSEDVDIYRKTVDGDTYTVSGSFSGTTLALSFSVDED